VSVVDFVLDVWVFKLWIVAGLLIAAVVWVAIKVYRAKREHAASAIAGEDKSLRA
jgi:hypothetical protein